MFCVNPGLCVIYDLFSVCVSAIDLFSVCVSYIDLFAVCVSDIDLFSLHVTGIDSFFIDLGSECVVMETSLNTNYIQHLIETTGRQAVLQGIGSNHGMSLGRL